MIKAVLFDFDGTLADTNPLIIRTFEETFNTLSPERALTREKVLDCIGPTLEQTGEKYFPDNPQAFVDYYRNLNDKYHDEMIAIFPGVIEMVKTLRDKGLKLAIVSSKRRDFVIRGLQQTKLLEYFDYIVAGDDVENPKPDPEPVIQALNHYGISPSEALMIGDNSHDIDGAKNANVTSIAVGWAIKGIEYLTALEPDYIVKTANEIVEIVENI